MKKIKMLELVFEVTRKCNLRCAGFCMRGESQNMILSRDVIDAVLKSEKCEIAYIHNLVLSGGEPTLQPEIIEYLVDVLIEKKIKVNLIRLVTNGQIFSTKIIKSLLKFNSYMHTIDKKDKDYFLILFSVDKYHSPILQSVKDDYLKYGINCDKNIMFSEVNMNIIKSGLNNNIGKEFIFKNIPVRYFNKNDFLFSIDEFYICANGNVTSNGMGSYFDMDMCNFGNIKDKTCLDILQLGTPINREKETLYQKMLGYIFQQWYNINSATRKYKINKYLINFFQGQCILFDEKGFSKEEIRKMNNIKEYISDDEIEYEFSVLMFKNDLDYKLYNKFLDLKLDVKVIKSLFILFMQNDDFDYIDIYKILGNMEILKRLEGKTMEKRDLYDENKIITNKTIFKNEEIPEGNFILMVVIFIQNLDGKFLIQKRSEEKGGEWAFTGGHPKSGETSLQGICTEVEEELGIKIMDPTLFKEAKGKNTFCDLYHLIQNINIENIKIQEEEVTDVKFVSKEKIDELYNKGQFKKGHFMMFKDYLAYLNND